MKLFARRNGAGLISVYNATIGAAEARRAGFLHEDGSSKELIKIVDEEAGTITLRLAPEPSPSEE